MAFELVIPKGKAATRLAHDEVLKLAQWLFDAPPDAREPTWHTANRASQALGFAVSPYTVNRLQKMPRLATAS